MQATSLILSEEGASDFWSRERWHISLLFGLAVVYSRQLRRGGATRGINENFIGNNCACWLLLGANAAEVRKDTKTPVASKAMTDQDMDKVTAGVSPG